MKPYKVSKTQMLFFIMLICFAFTSEQVLGGAWTQKKGKGYYKVDFRYLGGNKWYNSDGIKIPIPDFKDVTVGVFGSYGITEDLTGIVGASLFKSISLDSTSSFAGSDPDVKGFGDVNLGLKCGLAHLGCTVLSAKLILGLPTGKSTPDGGLWTGNSDFSQTIGTEIGHSFYPALVYLSGGISYTNRSKGFSDEFRYALEGGYKFFKNLSLIVRIHSLISVKNGNENVKGGFGIFSNNQQYFAYNAELVYNVTDIIGLKAYYESGGAGKNITSAPVLNAGIFFTY